MKPETIATGMHGQAYMPLINLSAPAYLAPNDDLIISTDVIGQVISRFEDDVWDVRVYCPKNKCVYNFSSWSDIDSPLKKVITKELKIAQLARLYLSGPPRKVNSTRIILLRKLARLALSNKATLTELFNDAKHYPSFTASFSTLSPKVMKAFLAVMRDLFSIRARHIDFLIAPPNYQLLERLEIIYNKYPKAKFNEPTQTKLIPSRIYGELIVGLHEILVDFNQHSSKIINLHENRMSHHAYAVPEAHSRRSKSAISWNFATRDLGLADFFKQQSLTNWKQLATYIGVVHAAAKYWIHLFSGMRDNEANFLPADTYASIKAGTASFKILKGYTSKIAAQNHTDTFWVTHEIVEEGVNAARSVGRISALMCGWDDHNRSQYPLFPGRIARKANTVIANKNTWHFKGAPTASSICDSAQLSLMSKIPALNICEEDIRELEMFDGFRNWREDPTLEIGAPWPLATHQCRRALAVYGARSGMLSLGAIALQFKQLTEAMASYYRKDSIFAVNFLQSDDARGWLEELEYERRAAQFMNYDNDVISTSSRLWGGEGNRIQQARDKGQPLIISTDRSLTEKKFFKGDMVYKVGPLGGCTNLEHCSKISFTSIFACVDCDKSILDDDQSLKKIKKGINNLVRQQALFSKNNPQHKQLESEIDALHDKLEKRGLLKKMEEME